MIAKELDKTRNAIYQKAHAMNLESKKCGSGQKWTGGEVEKLKSFYPIMGTSDLADELNRTEKSVRSKATSLGISKRKELTEEEQTRAELLFEKGKNVKEIAKKMNLPSNLIFNYLCEKERLEKMYYEDNLSQKKIGERFSSGQPQISDKMKEYGIETKSHDKWSDEEEEILSNLKIDCSIQKDNVWISKKDAEKFFKNINPVIKSKSPNDSGKEVINK